MYKFDISVPLITNIQFDTADNSPTLISISYA